MKIPTTLLALFAAFLLGACGDKDAEHGHGPDDDHDHAHEEHGEGEHGGAILELGAHEAHLELLHKPDTGAVSVWVLDQDLKELPIADPVVLNLVFESGPKQLTGTPVSPKDGKTAHWSFRDEALKGEPKSGRIQVKVGGKTYNPEYDDGHDHDHEHEDDDHDAEHEKDGE